MFQKKLINALEQAVGGYTVRAIILFLCSTITVILSISLWIAKIKLPYIAIFSACLNGPAVLNNVSWFTFILVMPALGGIYYIGMTGAYLVMGISIFLSYIVFRERTLRQEWERYFSLLLLLIFAPATVRCWYDDDMQFFISGGQWAMYIGEYLSYYFDIVPAFVFLHVMCCVAIILLCRFTLLTYFSYYVKVLLDYCVKYLLDIIHLRKKTIKKEHSPSNYYSSIISDLKGLNCSEKKCARNSSTGINAVYEVPDSIFSSSSFTFSEDSDDNISNQIGALEEKLASFGIKGSVVNVRSGPLVNLFEYQPQIDSKISKIIALEDDLALALQTVSIRIIAPVPGKNVVGFEVAKAKKEIVLLSDLLKSSSSFKKEMRLPIVLGKDVIGNAVVTDLTQLPHLLIAGSTGSGKSVALNSFLVSLLYKKQPDDMRLILIDPKRLEFSVYEDIPHLLFPIIIEPKQVNPILRWVVKEMERRYSVLAKLGVRNISDYQKKKKYFSNVHLPYIVIVIDEFADLIMLTSREVDELIGRIAQMARAAGIHMIIATQRPSVDVITGSIKVNFPSRVSFRVASKIDSRTVLDCMGAERLLGNGDMLFLDSTSSHLKRVHGAFMSDEDILSLVKHIRTNKEPSYQKLAVYTEYDEQLEMYDDLYNDVKHYLKTIDEVSISLIQRKFRIGYNRSARIVEMLESEGCIMPSKGGKTRKVIR